MPQEKIQSTEERLAYIKAHPHLSSIFYSKNTVFKLVKVLVLMGHEDVVTELESDSYKNNDEKRIDYLYQQFQEISEDPKMHSESNLRKLKKRIHQFVREHHKNKHGDDKINHGRLFNLESLTVKLRNDLERLEKEIVNELKQSHQINKKITFNKNHNRWSATTAGNRVNLTDEQDLKLNQCEDLRNQLEELQKYYGYSFKVINSDNDEEAKQDVEENKCIILQKKGGTWFIHAHDQNGEYFCKKLREQKRIDFLNQFIHHKNYENDQENFTKRNREKNLERIAKSFGAITRRKYTYIPDEQFQPLLTSEEKRIRRRHKRWLKRTAKAISLVVALGEALIAFVLSLGSIVLIVAFVFIGIPAFFSNYTLFKKDCYTILKGFYSGKIWKKANGSSLSKVEIAIIVASLVFSAAAAASLAFLTLGSATTAIVTILTGLGVTLAIANPIGLIIAGIVATISAIALFTLFSIIIVELVRNDQHITLAEKIVNLKEDVIDFFTHENWKDLDIGDKIKHVLSRALSGFLQSSWTAFKISVGIIVCVAYTALFKSSAVDVLHNIFHAGPQIANIIGSVIVGVGSPMNWWFYVKSSSTILDMLKAAFISICYAISHPSDSLKTIKNYWEYVSSHPIRLFFTTVTVIKQVALVSCVALNAYGHGSGPQHNATALGWTNKIIPLGRKIVSWINMITGVLGSAGANLAAVLKNSRLPRRKKRVNRSPSTTVSRSSTKAQGIPDAPKMRHNGFPNKKTVSKQPQSPSSPRQRETTPGRISPDMINRIKTLEGLLKHGTFSNISQGNNNAQTSENINELKLA